MATKQLAKFNESVNKLIEGKLILVDKNIAQVLQCVARSSILCKTLADTIKTMSYVTEFSRAKVSWTKNDGTVESRLKLPVDRNRLFAFVVCLLMEVDNGSRNFLDFLKEFYNDATNDLSYARFSEEVLKPFKSVGEYILRSVDPDSVNYQFVEQAELFFKAESIYVESAVQKSILDSMEEARLQLQQKKLNDVDWSELVVVQEYMVNALYLKNPKIIKLAWLAYKNVALRFELYDVVQAIALNINKLQLA